jgi:DNA-binding response OmpR family regulator
MSTESTHPLFERIEQLERLEQKAQRDKMNVLLVENNPVTARRIQTSLEREGFRVLWADSLRQANQINAKESLSLVILDLHLPDGNGFDFVSSMRALSSLLSIIIVSGRTDEEAVVEGLSRGADDFMFKPLVSRELLARIRAVQLRKCELS